MRISLRPGLGRGGALTSAICFSSESLHLFVYIEAKSIPSLFLRATRDCPVSPPPRPPPPWKRFDGVIYCWKWDGAFNYSLIILQMGSAVMFGLISGACAASAFVESKLVCNTIGFSSYSFPGPHS